MTVFPWQDCFLKAVLFPPNAFDFSTMGTFAAWSLSPGPWNCSPQEYRNLPAWVFLNRNCAASCFWSEGFCQAYLLHICRDQCWFSSRQNCCLSLLHNQTAGGAGGGGEACLEKPFFASKLCLKPLLPPGQILRSYTPTPMACTSLVKFPPTSSGGGREVAFPNQLITILSAKQKELWKNILSL